MSVIATNTAANSAVRYLNINSADQASSQSKIASGSRIVKASDDAAGLAISTKVSSDVVALNQAATNASHAISILQIADGAAANISDILMRMKALASQASSGTVTSTEISYIDKEYTALSAEIDSVATGARYNGQSLLDGTGHFSSAQTIVVGSDANDTISLTMSDLTAATLAVGATASGSMGALDTAIDTVSSTRADIGAQQSQFEFQAATIATSVENLEAANSAIKDTDIAAEQAKLASAKVKTQAAIAALTTANEMPQALLKLLQ